MDRERCFPVLFRIQKSMDFQEHPSSVSQGEQKNNEKERGDSGNEYLNCR